MERLIHSQLSHYIETNKIISGNQYGFRKGLSTSLDIFDILKVLYENWNDKLFSGCVFSRAFDSIDHNILMEKLKLYGLDQTPQNNSYKWSSFVRITGPYGTAQGSILGPLIFILYVNDIFELMEKDNSVFMYADDTLLIWKADNKKNKAKS